MTPIFPRTTRAAAAALLAAAAIAAPVVAQPSAAAGPGAGVGLSIDAYRFGTPEAVGVETLSLLTVPLTAETPLVGALRFRLATAFARGSMTRADGSSASLSSLTDSELRLTIPVARDRLTLSAIAVLPTGSASQSADEAEVAGLIAYDLLPFRIAHWGTGGGAGLGAAYRLVAGATRVDASAAYVVAREFEPLAADRFDYRAGDQVTAGLGVEHTVGDAGRATLQLALHHYADDEIEGERLYRPGNRVHAIGSYAFRVGGGSAGLVYLGALRRGEATALRQPVFVAAAQTVVLAGGGMRMPLAQAALLPSIDLRLLRSDDGLGQGYLTSVGATLELPAGAALLSPQLRLRVGNVVVRQGVESGVLGIDVGAAVRFGSFTRAR